MGDESELIFALQKKLKPLIKDKILDSLMGCVGSRKTLLT